MGDLPSNTRFVATADWHVKGRPAVGALSAVPETADDPLAALARAAGLCAAAGVPLVAAGDLSDTPRPDAAQVAAVAHALRPLYDGRGGSGKHPLVYCLGNHDGGQDWLAVLSAVGLFGVNVDLCREYPFEWAGTSYGGAGYRADWRAMLAAPPLVVADVGLYHQGWAELLGGGDRPAAAALPPHKCAVLGDVHVRRAWAGAGGPGLCVSPGPLAPQSVAQLGPVFCYAVTADWQTVPVPLPHRPVVRLRADMGTPLRVLVNAAETAAAAPGAVGRPVAVVDWDGPTPPPRGLAAACAAHGVQLVVRRTAAVTTVAADNRVRPPAADLAAAVAARLADRPRAAALAAAVLTAAADGQTAADRAADGFRAAAFADSDATQPDTECESDA